MSKELHPVQTHRVARQSAKLPSEITLRAYEVYCEVFSPQEALITGSCRGGFGMGELVAFLYARSFPKEEWRVKVDEALKGMEGM